uniref:Mannosyl-glycoprotein endo-beta-N-acetylglucosaminidase n=1 Tax=Parastrongyloides trichosuri TaxID=131310 RepID=A0A0N4ZG31_PARTI
MIKLVEVYNFDGWLINIENPLNEENALRMWSFVECLRSELKQKDKKNVVIWYDSVLENGKLHWQNELNEYNKIFFDACDGIYLNYQWDKEKLDVSRIYASEDRTSDVWVGIDIFGRKTYGGGGFDACIAMKEIHERGMSAVLFALGWLVECHEGKCILKQNEKFFDSIKKYLRSRKVMKLPIKTNFKYGFECDDVTKFCMAKMDIQPLIYDENNITRIPPKLKKDGGFEIAFNSKPENATYVLWYFDLDGELSELYSVEISYKRINGVGKLGVDILNIFDKSIDCQVEETLSKDYDKIKISFTENPKKLNKIILKCNEDSEFLINSVEIINTPINC